MKDVNEKFQFIPPDIHRRNSAEQSIRTFKEHFIAVLASTHKDFLLHIWCWLIPHASLTLNLLRQSRMKPKLSGYAQLHGEFNYNTTPLARHGIQVIINEKPAVRGTWASHGVKWWYLVPSMNHYRCHSVYVTKNNRREGLRLHWIFPHNTPLPYNYSSENFIIAAHKLAHSLKNPEPQVPFYNISDSQMVTIEQLSDIFSKVADNLNQIADPPKQQPVKKSAIMPHKVRPNMTKPIFSENPNIIEDHDGKCSTSFQYKVHMYPSGPHVIIS